MANRIVAESAYSKLPVSSQKYLAEMIGTFALVFAGTGAIVVNDTYGSVTDVGIALTFGLIVTAMVYSIGDVSGAHINPAVTIGFWVAGRFDKKQVWPYIVSQVSGAMLASTMLRYSFPAHPSLGTTIPADSWRQAFMFEFLLTSMLMFVILRVSSGNKETGLMAGVAIGGTVALEALIGGPVSGASMNPARSLAPALLSGSHQSLWIYFVATIGGAVFAVLLNRGVGCVDQLDLARSRDE